MLLAIGSRDPVAYMVLSRRRRQKLFGTYVKPFIGVDRAYTHFRLDLATGRLGSWGFNSQNLPSNMRGIFEPNSGIWTWMDLEQAELRVWANQAKDEVMLDSFRRGESPHEVTLKALFPGKPKKNPDGSSTQWYVDAKGFNFSILADASVEVLAKSTKRPISVVESYKAELYKLYWRTVEHQAYMRQRHQPDFYPDWVESDFGRRCHIPECDALRVNVTHQEKCRLNYPFQATIADVIKRIMLALDALGMDFPIQVHDEVLQDGDDEFPQWLKNIHPVMEIPFEISRGTSWT